MVSINHADGGLFEMFVSKSLSRRSFIGGIVVLPALATALTARAAADNSKSSQASMHYQTTPNGSMHCSECKFFVPGQDAQSNGTCQIVDGSISPNGYCIAFTSK
jgi:high potential iron-sulfur protein